MSMGARRKAEDCPTWISIKALKIILGVILPAYPLPVWFEVFYEIRWGPQPKVTQENVTNEVSHVSFSLAEMCICGPVLGLKTRALTLGKRMELTSSFLHKAHSLLHHL